MRHAIRRMLLLTTVLLMAGMSGYGQQPGLGGFFEWISPHLGGEQFLKIHEVGQGNLEIISRYYVLRSSDNGATWEKAPRDPVSLDLASKAFFLDDRHGWSLRNPYASGVQNESLRDVMYTDNGGLTWEKRGTLPPGGFYRNMQFADEFNGWANGDYGLIAKTTDGGTTWTAIERLTSGFTFINSLYVVTSNLVFVAIPYDHEPQSQSVGGLFRTSDGGATWDTLTFPEKLPGFSNSPTISTVAFPSSTTGYAFTTVGQVYKSTDAGKTWTRKPTGLKDKVADPITGQYNEPKASLAYFVDTDHGWMLSKLDEIFNTTNGGESWARQDSGSAPTFYSSELGVGGKIQIVFPIYTQGMAIDEQTMIVIGANGEIRRTTDGGATWSKINKGVTPEDLHAVRFVDEMIGWTAGARGTILKTTDGGATWNQQSSGIAQDIIALETLNDPELSDNNRAWGLLSNGALRTIDGGAWQATIIPDFPTAMVSYQELGETKIREVGARDIAFVDAQNGWIVGAKGALYATTDGGVTWTRRPAPANSTQILNGICFIDAQNGWIAANGGSILKTTNGGATWSESGPNTVLNIIDVLFSDADNGVAVGAEGTAYRTTNGGTTWSMQATGKAAEWTEGGYLKLAQSPQGMIWTIGTSHSSGGGGHTARSTDGGQTWSDPLLLTYPRFGQLHDVTFSSASTGWLVGDHGTVIKYTAITSSAGTTKAVGSSVTLIAYPNPVRDGLTIDAAIARSSDVRLRLYDLLGAERATLYDGPVEAGRLTVRATVEELPAGTYFLRLDAGGAKATTIVTVAP